MAKFRKKPVVIEAVQLPKEPGLAMTPCPPPQWYDDAIKANVLRLEYGENGEPEIRVKTLEGVMTAYPGDWIIRGVKGELYPCKPDIFEATYEAFDQPTFNGVPLEYHENLDKAPGGVLMDLDICDACGNDREFYPTRFGWFCKKCRWSHGEPHPNGHARKAEIEAGEKS